MKAWDRQDLTDQRGQPGGIEGRKWGKRMLSAAGKGVTLGKEGDSVCEADLRGP